MAYCFFYFSLLFVQLFFFCWNFGRKSQGNITLKHNVYSENRKLTHSTRQLTTTDAAAEAAAFLFKRFFFFSSFFFSFSSRFYLTFFVWFVYANVYFHFFFWMRVWVFFCFVLPFGCKIFSIILFSAPIKWFLVSTLR